MEKVAIIGAGISGLYLANLLEKNSNYDYKIFEKRTKIDLNNNYGIQLSINSINLLNKVGFKEIQSREIAFPKMVNFYDAKSCKKICDIDISKFNFEDNRYSTLKRSTLIKFLLKNIPPNKIVTGSQPHNIESSKKIKIYYENNLTEKFDYLIVSDGVFSKTKLIITKKESSPRFYNSIALRGIIKNIHSNDISIYMGSNFHFVIYPISQNNEYNFICIMKKKLDNKQLLDKKLFKSDKFLKTLCEKIYQKTKLDLKDKIENIISFPVFVSKKPEIINKKNIYFVGDALFTFPPSFAQGASQSIESSNEVYEEIINKTNTYYKKRLIRIKSVNYRSKLNFFTFHLSNPITVYVRNIFLKYLTKKKNFLESYLGKIYKG